MTDLQGNDNMANDNSGLSCSAGCWLMAAAAGLAALILLLVIGNFGIIAALFLSGVLVVGLGLLFGYLFCGELSPAKRGEEAQTKAPAPKAAAPAAPTPKSDAPDEKEAGEKDAEEEESESESPVTTGTLLPGEEELAARKGEWKYEGAAQTPATTSAGGGTRPEGLPEARGGQPDDLKRIKGIGPKLEKLLNSMGYYHFDQIAAWGPEEVAWVDDNLEGFKGRVSRDDWVEQARTLAAGGE